MFAAATKFLLRISVLAFVAGTSIAKEMAPVVLLAGDVAQCDSPGAQLTAQLIKSLPYPVLAVGDLAYPDGTAEEFSHCYAPNWGAFKDRTYPAPGNHEYRTPGAAAYFNYFGVRAGEAGKGYYSFDLGAWHIVSLNSNRELEVGSAQMHWLEADLRQHRQRYVLAYWHHPRYSSGPHGSDARTQAFWVLLYRNGVSVVVTGHDHIYELFAPMNAQGARDPVRGIRSFVAGTGGAQHYALKQRIAWSEVSNGESWGVLKMTLNPDSYAWEFLPVAGQTFRDAGNAQCVAR
jgi:acid phosphatase type 7